MRLPGITKGRPALMALLAVAVVVIACVAAGLARAPAASIPEATVRPVTAAVLACPRPVAGNATSTQVGVVTALPASPADASPSDESGLVGPGQVVLAATAWCVRAAVQP